jgi:DNA-binding SARP family transcriptional activator
MRHDTITQLRRHLSAVILKSPGQVLAVSGPAGIGKTHSLQGLLAELPCKHLSFPSHVPLLQLAQALPRPTSLPGWVRTRLEGTDGAGLEDALAVTLQALAPFVLHLEDLHEASPERLELILALARLVPRLRGVALIASSRVDPPAPFRAYRLEGMEREVSDALLHTQVSTAQVSTAQIGTAQLPEAGLEWVYGRANGNPLFTLEYWRYLVRQGAFWSDGQHWHWRKPSDDFLPDSIEALISVLIGQRTNEITRTILEAHALLEGRASRVDTTLWASVAGLSLEALQCGTATLEANGLLIAEGFAHPLFREVLMREAAPERWRELAQRALRALSTDQPEIAAAFISDAKLDNADALHLLERARLTAETRGDTPAAAQWLARTIDHLEEPVRGERALAASRAAFAFDLALAERLVTVAATAPVPSLEARVFQAEVLAHRGQSESALAILETLRHEEHVKLQHFQTLMFVTQQKGHFEEILRLWEAHPELHEHVDTYTRSHVCFALNGLRRDDAADAAVAEMFNHPLCDLKSQYYAWNMRMVTAITRNQYAQAADVAATVVSIARQRGLPNLIAQSLRNAAMLHRILRQFDEAETQLHEALKLCASSGHTKYHARIQDGLAGILRERGRFEEAESLYREAQTVHALDDTLPQRCENHLDQAELYLIWQPTSGAPLALMHARAGLRDAREMGAPYFLGRALALSAQAEALNRNSARALKLGLELHALEGTQGFEPDAGELGWGAALEVSGRSDEALHVYETAHGAYLSAGDRTNAERMGLEADRLRGDLEQARTRHAWFTEHGLLGFAWVATRYFPQINNVTQPLKQPVSTLHLKVLGLPQLERDGTRLLYRGKKRLELLCYLLEARIAGKSEVSAMELAEVFYPDTSERNARHTLRQQIYLIRADLGGGCIHSTTNGYALAEVSSDAEQFLESGDTRLWRGAYLERSSEGWDGNVRESLVQGLRSSFERIADTDTTEAARVGCFLVEMEPYDAELLRASLRVHERSGDRRTANKLYKKAQERFWSVEETLPDTLEEFLRSSVTDAQKF